MTARLSLAVATALGVGYVPFAPGTFGSLAGLALFAGVRATGQPAIEIAAIVVVFLAGTWAATAAETHFGGIDPGPVVIDEVLGMLVTLVLLPCRRPAHWRLRAVPHLRRDQAYPCNRLERLPGGWGVMCDDFMAAIYAHVCVRLLAWVRPAWMLA